VETDPAATSVQAGVEACRPAPESDELVAYYHHSLRSAGGAGGTGIRSKKEELRRTFVESRATGMKTLRTVLVAAPLLVSTPAFGQTLHPGVGGEVIGTASMFQYPRDVDRKWRPAAGARVRLVLLGWTHLELGYTKAWTREEQICLPESECPESASNPSELLSASVGFQFQVHEWVPYLGFGTGKFSNQYFDSGTSVWYVGLRRKVLDRLSILGEYRRTRFDSYSGRHYWNRAWEIGVGVPAT